MADKDSTMRVDIYNKAIVAKNQLNLHVV